MLVSHQNKVLLEQYQIFAAKEGLNEEFEDIVNNCVIEEEFEYLWGKMIEERELQ